MKLNTPLIADGDDIRDADGVMMFDSDHAWDFSFAESSAQAAEIVRRVNLHEEMVAAARRVANLNENAGEIGDGMLRTIVAEARAVLIKLESKP